MPPHAAETGFHQIRCCFFPLQPERKDPIGGIVSKDGSLRQGGNPVKQVPTEVPRQGSGKDIPPAFPAPLTRPPEGVRQMGSGEEPGLGQDQIGLSNV